MSSIAAEVEVTQETGGLSAGARRGLVAAIVVLLPVVLLAGAWRLGGVSALEDDLLYYLPLRQHIGERIAAGDWPLWNPYVLMGSSIAADPQSGLWYPPTWLFALMPAEWAYPATLALHFALAGAGMYRLLRAGRNDWRAALLAAVAFEFCGFLIAHRAHLTIHHATAWLPWMLLAWRRLADTGAYRHFALAVVVTALHLLVQHTQMVIYCGALVAAYVLLVLAPGCWRVVWKYSAGAALAGCISAVQTLPTYYHFAGSARGVPSYNLFTENSLVPLSGLLMLFPMLFGNRTPNLWSQPWWGLSHFCEQAAYGTILMLMLALASWPLIRRAERGSRFRREVLFWWAACAVALLIALGSLNPMSRLLFQLPVYNSLRSPARWVFVISTAIPILAAMVLTCVLRGGEQARGCRRAVRIAFSRVLPGVALAAVGLMVYARWNVAGIEAAYRDRYGAASMVQGMKDAIHMGNPAIWWPLVLMAASAAAALYWLARPKGRRFAALGLVLLIDLASLVPFLDVDTPNEEGQTYSREDIFGPSPLAASLAGLPSGQRLLVPRQHGDYEMPLEVLWPQTNVRHHVEVLNAYGPFWPLAQRLTMRFMPWGSSEAMLERLRRPGLLETFGVRYVAAQSFLERQLMRAAFAPAASQPAVSLGQGTQEVPDRAEVYWPIEVDSPGLYELRFKAIPRVGSSSRWFLRLETPQKQEISWTRTLEPVDLSLGPRDLGFTFEIEKAGPARFLVKSEKGIALSVTNLTFRKVAESPTVGDPPSARFVPRAEVRGAGVVQVYELPDAVEFVRLAESCEVVPDLLAAVDRLVDREEPPDLPGTVILEHSGPAPPAGPGTVAWRRVSPELIEAEVETPTGGVLVINQTFDAGWSATIGGRPTTIYRANALAQGLLVPPGTSRVRLQFVPRGHWAGVALAFLGSLTLAAGGFLSLRRDSSPGKA